MNKFLIYLFFLVLLSNCSKNVKEENLNAENIFKKSEPINRELNSSLNIQLKKLTKGEPFYKNDSNNNGNINFETNFKKTHSYKFKTINQFKIYQPELIFTNDQNIIFFDGKGSIFKINESLKEVWKVNYYNKKERKLKPILYFAQNDQRLLITDTLSKLYSVNLFNGEIEWSKESKSAFNSNIKIYKDTFIAIDFDNVIRCFSVKDGKELWTFKAENSFIKSQKKLSLIIKGEMVFFNNNLGDITALNVNDGSLIWQTPTQSNLIYQNAFTLQISDLVFDKNSIFFSNNKNELFSIDARSGIVNWKQKVNSILRPTVIENLIFSISEQGYLFVINSQTGNIARISYVLNNIKNKKNQIKPIGFIIAKNKIYLSLNNGSLVKINVATGVQENIFKISASKISRPYVINNNMYLIKDNGIIKSN